MTKTITQQINVMSTHICNIVLKDMNARINHAVKVNGGHFEQDSR